MSSYTSEGQIVSPDDTSFPPTDTYTHNNHNPDTPTTALDSLIIAPSPSPHSNKSQTLNPHEQAIVGIYAFYP